MNNSKKPFHEENYQQKDRDFYPVLGISCELGKTKISFRALADTGCDGGIVLLKNEVDILAREYKGFELGDRINEEPLEVCVADGHVIGFDVYPVKLELGGEMRVVELWVVDPDNIIRHQREEQTAAKHIFPAVGRSFLNHFNVMFHGRERKVSVFKEA